jgi:hypothetical protein
MQASARARVAKHGAVAASDHLMKVLLPSGVTACEFLTSRMRDLVRQLPRASGAYPAPRSMHGRQEDGAADKQHVDQKKNQ